MFVQPQKPPPLKSSSQQRKRVWREEISRGKVPPVYDSLPCQWRLWWCFLTHLKKMNVTCPPTAPAASSKRLGHHVFSFSNWLKKPMVAVSIQTGRPSPSDWQYRDKLCLSSAVLDLVLFFYIWEHGHHSSVLLSLGETLSLCGIPGGPTACELHSTSVPHYGSLQCASCEILQHHRLD